MVNSTLHFLAFGSFMFQFAHSLHPNVVLRSHLGRNELSTILKSACPFHRFFVTRLPTFKNINNFSPIHGTMLMQNWWQSISLSVNVPHYRSNRPPREPKYLSLNESVRITVMKAVVGSKTQSSESVFESISVFLVKNPITRLLNVQTVKLVPQHLKHHCPHPPTPYGNFYYGTFYRFNVNTKQQLSMTYGRLTL